LALEDLFKEVILDHYKNPRNKRPLTGAVLSCTANNPLCGDELTVHARIEGDHVAEVTFEGTGCSISQASASMMTEAVSGKSLADAQTLAANFRSMMEGKHDPTEEEFGDLVALKGVVKYPVRIKCAVLAWDVLQDSLAAAGSAPGEATHAR
jgi:nitrogen fixation NifU-like protein